MVRYLICVSLISTAVNSSAQDVKWTIENLEDMVITRDVDYLEDVDYSDNKDKLDIFMPENAKDVPVIVFFHGGALQQGNKSWGENIAARLVPLGFGVVSANYRLSPGVMHPAHIEDATAAFAWVVENIKQYGGDPDQLIVSGHSAGAYLAVLMALDESFLAGQKLKLKAIEGTIAISPFLYVEETAKTRPMTVWGEDPANWLRASVTPQIAKDKAPILLIYADGDADWRKEQNDRFAKNMKGNGNVVQVFEQSNRKHLTIITDMNKPDDEIGEKVAEFVMKISDI